MSTTYLTPCAKTLVVARVIAAQRGPLRVSAEVYRGEQGWDIRKGYKDDEFLRRARVRPRLRLGGDLRGAGALVTTYVHMNVTPAPWYRLEQMLKTAKRARQAVVFIPRCEGEKPVWRFIKYKIPKATEAT